MANPCALIILFHLARSCFVLFYFVSLFHVVSFCLVLSHFCLFLTGDSSMGIGLGGSDAHKRDQLAEHEFTECLLNVH
jgi:hypothetical protein